MTFGLNLKKTLQNRTIRVPTELATGQSLEQVLSRHLVAVESTADTVLLTSILLLDRDGKRLWHAAAPSLPQPYCDAINGIEIGPNVGSCGTAAFHGHAIYVTDIANDPLWSDFRHLALPHRLRACWSTPIRDGDGVLVGTFAVYHLTPRSPTPGEVEAIRLITDHVAGAIQSYRIAQDLGRPAASGSFARTSVWPEPGAPPAAAIGQLRVLKSLEADFGQIASAIEVTIAAFPHAELDGLLRARRAAGRGQLLARKLLNRD